MVYLHVHENVLSHNAMIYKIHVCFVQHAVEVFVLLLLFLLAVVKNEHLFVYHVRFLTRAGTVFLQAKFAMASCTIHPEPTYCTRSV